MKKKAVWRFFAASKGEQPIYLTYQKGEDFYLAKKLHSFESACQFQFELDKRGIEVEKYPAEVYKQYMLKRMNGLPANIAGDESGILSARKRSGIVKKFRDSSFEEMCNFLLA